MGEAAITDVLHPLRVTRTEPRTTLATGDHPVDAIEVEQIDRTQEWLSADEADGRRDTAQEICTPHVGIGFDGNPYPNMLRPREISCKAS